MAQVIRDGKVVFENGKSKREFMVIKADYVREVALLHRDKSLMESRPYVVVTGYKPDSDSWGGGNYDLTLEDAEEAFKEATE